jgi:pimeloyl-ACP methyl ester carboxylesterase
VPQTLHNGVTLSYEEHGAGFPVLLFAPGGMHSVVEFWSRMPYNPIEVLADRFRVIAMDQRNAGRSFSPVEAAGWESYAADAAALLGHLGIDRAHIMGGCIGSSFCLAFLERAGQRVAAAVLQNPIGLSDTNRPLFQGRFEEAAAHAEQQGMAAVLTAAREEAAFGSNALAGPWGARALADPAFAADLKALDPTDYAATVREYGARLFGGDFVFSVSERFVRSLTTPLLILAGNDDFHPRATAERLASLAPNAELVLDWREPEVVPRTVEKVRDFLTRHTPRD